VPQYNPLLPFTASYYAIVSGKERLLRRIGLENFPLGPELNNPNKILVALPTGTTMLRVRITANTRTPPRTFTGVRCLVTTDTVLIQQEARSETLVPCGHARGSALPACWAA
jgi:hypothetical protein